MFNLPDVPIRHQIVEHHCPQSRSWLRWKRPLHSIDSGNERRAPDGNRIGYVELKGRRSVSKANALLVEKITVTEQQPRTSRERAKLLVDLTHGFVKLARTYEIDELRKLAGKI